MPDSEHWVGPPDLIDDLPRSRVPEMRRALLRADSVMSLIVHRYPAYLPEDVIHELRGAYAECRLAIEGGS